MYNLKQKIYDIKRTPVKKKIFSAKNGFGKCIKKIWGSLIKSQILKIMIQQKVFNKKAPE